MESNNLNANHWVFKWLDSYAYGENVECKI